MAIENDQEKLWRREAREAITKAFHANGVTPEFWEYGSGAGNRPRPWCIVVHFPPVMTGEISKTTCMRGPDGTMYSIRFAPAFYETAPAWQRRSAAVHEAAHVIAAVRYGSDIASHGHEWRAVMRVAGEEPERSQEVVKPTARSGRGGSNLGGEEGERSAYALDHAEHKHFGALRALLAFRRKHPDLAKRAVPGTRGYELVAAEREAASFDLPFDAMETVVDAYLRDTSEGTREAQHIARSCRDVALSKDESERSVGSRLRFAVAYELVEDVDIVANAILRPDELVDRGAELRRMTRLKEDEPLPPPRATQVWWEWESKWVSRGPMSHFQSCQMEEYLLQARQDYAVEALRRLEPAIELARQEHELDLAEHMAFLGIRNLTTYREEHPELAKRVVPGTRAHELVVAEREASRGMASLAGFGRESRALKITSLAEAEKILRRAAANWHDVKQNVPRTVRAARQGNGPSATVYKALKRAYEDRQTILVALERARAAKRERGITH